MASKTPDAPCMVYMLAVKNTSVFVLLEKQKKLTYVGITQNVSDRYAKHNRKGETSTRGNDWTLVQCVELPNVATAHLLEVFLKNGNTKQRRAMFWLIRSDQYWQDFAALLVARRRATKSLQTYLENDPTSSLDEHELLLSLVPKEY